MSGRFQSGTYIPRTGFDWKKIMEVECLKLESWLKAKEELKLSESETEYLKQKGIVLTTMDIACIKRTEGTELVFLSKDKKALFYKGEIYPIYVPDNEISFQPIWKLDGKKEISAMEFDALEGILGFSLEEIPKEDIYTTSGHKVLSGELSSTDPNVKAAAGLSALLGLTQFTLSSLSKSEVTVIFQSSEGGNRGTICVGNSEDRATFQNWNYNIPMDTYRDSEPGIGKIWASDYAAGIYKIASGKDVPNPDGTYTITGTLDERHKDTNISGYLSYSTDGKLMYTPLTYSGDKAYIESVDGFMEFGRTQILDFSDKLSTPSFADEDSQKFGSGIVFGSISTPPYTYETIPRFILENSALKFSPLTRIFPFPTTSSTDLSHEYSLTGFFIICCPNAISYPAFSQLVFSFNTNDTTIQYSFSVPLSGLFD